MKELNEEMKEEWELIMQKLTEIAGKRPKDLNVVLFLIGIRELGQNRTFTKEEKQDLIHIAICKLLSSSGYYSFEGWDEEGWPHWKKTHDLPYHNLAEQTLLLKDHIIRYFKDEEII